MNLEKIGLMFLLNYFNQLGDVKHHMMQAFREVLMAMQSSIEIVSKTSEKALNATPLEPLQSLMGQVQSVVRYAVDWVEPYTDTKARLTREESIRLKENVVNSIISAINDEIETTRVVSSEKNKLKVEALQTVKQVLINQKKKSSGLEDMSRTARAA